MPKPPLTDEEIASRSGKVTVRERKSAVGNTVPNITLPATENAGVNLWEVAQVSDIVLFVYPGNGKGLDYPELMGCTPEACSFRDAIHDFERQGIKVFGMSMQPTDEQKDFAQAQGLNFPILSDQHCQMTNALDINTWHTDDGTRQVFPARETLYIQQGGVVAKHIKNITFADISTHVSDVLTDVAQIKSVDLPGLTFK